MVSVGVYTRISDDKNDTAAGVARQEQDCRLVAQARRWDVAEVYEDNDLSAFKRAVIRPRFEDMLMDLSTGKIDGIVAYDLDRFTRQPSDLERAIALYETKKDLVFATVQGDINLSTADGLTMARVMVAFANKSSLDTGRRVARKHLENARSGKPVGGYRPFGWQADKATLDARESALARDAIAKLIAGHSIRSIVREWNEAGVTTSAGSPWKNSTLRQYLRNPRLAGIRTHQREVLLDEQGHPVRGLWEPLVDQDTFDRLQLVLERPETRSRIPRRGARHYLLTGLVRCGVCNSLMYGNRYGQDRHYYVCSNDSGKKHGNTVSGVGVDTLVTRAVLQVLAGEDLGAQPVAEWHGERRLAEIQESIDTLMDDYLAKRLSGDLVHPRVAALTEEQAQLREDRAQWLTATTGPVVRQVTAEEWGEMEVDLRRSYVEELIEAVLIRPSTQPRGNRLDPERVDVLWRAAPPASLAVAK